MSKTQLKNIPSHVTRRSKVHVAWNHNLVGFICEECDFKLFSEPTEIGPDHCNMIMTMMTAVQEDRFRSWCKKNNHSRKVRDAG